MLMHAEVPFPHNPHAPRCQLSPMRVRRQSSPLQVRLRSPGKRGLSPVRPGNPVVGQFRKPLFAVPPAEFQANMVMLMEKPAALEERIRIRFREIARLDRRRSVQVMQFSDVERLTSQLACHLQVGTEVFGEMQQMFWRFDFDGDGQLVEDEATKMCFAMLRHYREATSSGSACDKRSGVGISYKRLHDKYTLETKLGQGGQGAAYLCKDKNSDIQFCLKMYDKSNRSVSEEEITKEFELLLTLRHPRIARVFEIFQDHSNVYIIQEPYFGGDLSSAMQKASDAGVTLDEQWLGKVFQQILHGVAFLHKSEVIHCDLKEANVMLTGHSQWHAPQVVVIDFGLAHRFERKSRPGGTPGYIPPEVWDHGFWTPKGDVFSIGVMAFAMRTGQRPFVGHTLEEIKLNTKAKHPLMMAGSLSMQRFVHSMLVKNFVDRPSLLTVMGDRWFSEIAEEEHTIQADVLARLSRQTECTDLRRAVLAEIASRENLAQMTKLNDAFIKLDKDNDGLISSEEVQNALEGRWPQHRIDALIRALVGEHGRDVTYEEFMGQVMAAVKPLENELLWRFWLEADTNGKGFLDLADIKDLLTRPAVSKILGERKPEDIMQQMGCDKDQKISFTDFKRAMQDQAESMQWSIGQEAQYYSTTHACWMACNVTAIHPRKEGLEIDCKPGYWLKGTELQTKLRPKDPEEPSRTPRRRVNPALGGA